MTVRLHIQVENVIGEINNTLPNDHLQIDSRILKKNKLIQGKNLFLTTKQDGTLMRDMIVYEGQAHKNMTKSFYISKDTARLENEKQ